MRRLGVLLAALWIALATQSAAAAGQILTQPALGGSASAFEQAMGGANDASIGALLHFQRCAGTDIDQFVLLAPNDQVWTIQRQWCDLATLSAEDRFADAANFIPADAVPGDSFTTELGETARTYVSSTLATTLPAGLFHDCDGNTVAAGTLFVIADSFGGWYMGPGTCPNN